MIVFSSDAASDIERIREFLDINNPEAAKRALRVIWAALERVQAFPELGRPTEDADIRQIVVRFGAAGYIVRYTIPVESGDVVVLRLWHVARRERNSRVACRFPSKTATSDKRRRTAMVPVTTTEEIPVLSDKERAELTTSLKEAEARVKAGKAIDYDPKTFRDPLVGIYRGANV